MSRIAGAEIRRYGDIRGCASEVVGKMLELEGRLTRKYLRREKGSAGHRNKRRK
jgi:hypothetical protein